MYFDPSAPMEAAGAILVRFASIIDRSALAKRADALRAQMDENPVLGHFLRIGHAVELTLNRIFLRRRTTGRWPKRVSDAATAEALSFAFALTEVHRRLSPSARTELERRLYGSLKGPNSLAPIVHELVVSTHLMNRGWDVDFHDLEEGGRVDYVAKNGAEQIEIECKRASADKGRKIHRNDFGRFAGPLLPALREFARRGHADIVHLRVEDRFPSGDQDLSRLQRGVLSAMEAVTDIDGHGFAVGLLRAGLSHPSMAGEAVLRQEIEHHLGTEHYQLLYAVEGSKLSVLASRAGSGTASSPISTSS